MLVCMCVCVGGRAGVTVSQCVCLGAGDGGGGGVSNVDEYVSKDKYLIFNAQSTAEVISEQV